MTEQDNDRVPGPEDTDAAREPAGQSDEALNALGGLGAGEKREASIDALAAMADNEGKPRVESRQPVDLDPAAETPRDSAAANAPEAFADMPTGDEAFQMRRRRAASVHKQAHRAHAQQYKQFMIPVLIVTGALLFILATIVALTMGGSYSPGDDPWYQDPSTKKVLVLLAYPLGAILGLGAWLFYVDVQRHKKK